MDRSRSDSAWPLPERGVAAFVGVPVLALAFHLATARGYGIFRDELYYLACGEHLDGGYVDHPPAIGWIAAAVRATLGDSLHALRALPALAAGLTALCASGIARELGGSRFAQALAGAATALAPISLALASFLSMNAFDLLLWTAGWWVLVRVLLGGDARLWCLYGVIVGLALENKLGIVFQAAGVLAGLVAWRRFDVLAGRWPWIGAGVALALFAPHLVWQSAHGWPTREFMHNARTLKMVELSPAAFLGEVGLESSPLALPVLLAGVVWLVALAPRALRPLGVAWLAILAALIATGGKPYYFAPALPLAFAAGGVALERWSARRLRRTVRAASVALVAAGGAITAPLAKPLLPVETFVRYQARLGLAPNVGERHEVGRLPQFFADMHGWRELAGCVAEVHRTLPPDERERARVFGQNYGEAGAIDFFGRELGLAPALSGHNSYFLWGPGDWDGGVLIVIGDRRERLLELFESVEAGATFECADCMPYENGLTIWIARGLRGTVGELWPLVKRYI